MERLETEHVSAYFDNASGIMEVTYKGSLTSQTTSQVYRWIAERSQEIPPDKRYGAIFDFSQVTSFQLGNVQTAQQESREINQRFDFSHVPIALVAATPYQEGMITVSMKLNPQQKRLRLVHSREDALTFFKEWHLENPRIPANARHIVDTEAFRAYYDPATQLGMVTYRSVITPSITSEAYHWGITMAHEVGIAHVRGGVYDFRQVQEFKQDFQTVKRESRGAHQQVDLSRTAIALLVETLYQEQMVKVSSKVTGQEKRVQIVHSMAEALQFIEQWHVENPQAG